MLIARFLRAGRRGPGLAPFRMLPSGGPAKSVSALTAFLAAAVACGAGAWAQGAVTAGRGATAAAMRPANEDAADSGDALAWHVQGVTLVQERDRFVVKDLIGYGGRQVAVAIEMPLFARTDHLLLSFRGVPENFALSSGFRTASAWLVSAHEAANLSLIPPEDFVGSFKLEVLLIRGQSVPPLVQSVRVEFRPEALAEQDFGALTRPAAAEKRTEPDKEKQLMEVAADLLRQNDIAAARLIYARLAHERSVQGALAMAQTYDPVFLSKYNVTGLRPDKEKAKHWYGAAASLGSKDAPERLLTLEATEPR